MKRRLVGAVVLVSLAVIFIPMLLDGGQQKGMPLFGSNIPEKPDYRFEPLDIPLEPVEPIAEDKPLLIEKPESEPEPAPATPVAGKPAEKPPIEEAAPPATEPSLRQVPVAWVVQAGSFSSSENALGLRDKLRANGFTAFVEKLKSANETIYRVRIGPELKREAAEAQRDKLQRMMKINGIVMGHSS
ncbi:MAG: SPOR domain-containing protein [Gammaproteobacteria bacterium]|nr:SPOR domain-containing protein [Gammaproteobacteria bacterium]